MHQDARSPEPERSRFRNTLIRVLLVQTVAVALLGLIQIVYGL